MEAVRYNPEEFFTHLRWLNDEPLLSTIEPYRLKIFNDVLYTFDEDDNPQYDQALLGRAKKNFKTTDLCLAALYRFFVWPSPQGNDCYILANDRDQAADDLTLVKKLIQKNESLNTLVKIQQNKIIREDNQSVLEILPAKDAVGSHGKTFLFLGFDEIHGYRNWDIIEALSPDPTRPDTLVWISTYDSFFNSPGVPLYDLKEQGKAGTDDKFYFSWYSGEYCTDPDFEQLPTAELRANPSIAQFKKGYLEKQKKRLPSFKYRRLHLNLPGAPEGQFLDPDRVAACIVRGRKRVKAQIPTPENHYEPSPHYQAFVDMSGGSSDDACLAIAHREQREDESKIVLDYLGSQPGQAKPFNPKDAIKKFVKVCKEYGISKITGDAYSGNTHRAEFEAENITYELSPLNKSNLYYELEVEINNEGVELLDHELGEFQLYTLTANRSGKVDHQPGDHDDYANAIAGAVYLCRDDSDQVDFDTDALSGLEKESHWANDLQQDDTPAAERTHKGLLW